MIDPQEVIDIRDPEINVEEIMQRLRERIHQRRLNARAEGKETHYLLQSEASASSENPFSGEFYYDLRLLREQAESIWVSPSVVGRPLPLLNRLWLRVRRAAHELVIYYVNMLAGRQVTVNRTTANLLGELVQVVETLAKRVETLERELAELRATVSPEETTSGDSSQQVSTS